MANLFILFFFQKLPTMIIAPEIHHSTLKYITNLLKSTIKPKKNKKKKKKKQKKIKIKTP